MAVRHVEPPIWLVTGASGSGKTSFCHKIVQKKRLDGWRISGLVSPGVFENGVKTAIQAVDLRSGETRLFAVKAAEGDDAVQVGDWMVRREAIRWGNEVLSRWEPCDLLVIDELGPLEFLQGGGWQSAFSRLERRDYLLALVVVRPELLEAAYTRIRAAGEIDVQTINEDVRLPFL